MDARNNWQPVTDVYQEIANPASASPVDDDPMTLVNAVRQARSMAQGKVPFGITAITGLYFIRAAIYGLFAAKLVSSDGNSFSWITLHAPALIPITLSADPKTLPTTMAEALAVMAILSLGMGILWLLRWKPILFISVALAGYYIAHVVLSFFNVAGLGDPNLFGSEQLNILVLEGALNLLVFFFVATYPNLKNTFRRDF